MSGRDESETSADATIVVSDPAVRALLPRYLERRRADVARIGELLTTDNFAEIRVIAHNMRGSGSAYGIEFVTTTGTAMEHAARAGDRDAIRRAVSELDAFLTDVRFE